MAWYDRLARFVGYAAETPKPVPKGIPHQQTFAAILNTVSRTYSWRYDEALRHNPQNAIAMRRDCYLMSLLQERLLPSAQMEWSVVPENVKDPRQVETAGILTAIIKRTPRWTMLQQNLLQAVWYGRYGSQIHWGEHLIEGKPYHGVLDHTPVNGDKIQFGWDKVPAVFVNSQGLSDYPKEWVIHTDRVPALRLQAPELRERFIIHQHEVDDADYFEGEMAGMVGGVGLRSRIYWAQWLRDEMLAWAVTCFERAGTHGVWIFWYESNNARAQDAATNAASKFEKDNVLVMPRPATAGGGQSWGCENLPPNTQGIDALKDMIQDYFERNMERLIVGQTLSSGTEGSGLGGSGVAEMHANTKFNLIKYDSANRDETITRDLLGPLVRHNAHLLPEPNAYYQFASSVPDPDKKDKMEAVSKASALGVTFKADEVRELTGLGKPGPDDEVVGGKPQGQPGGDQPPMPGQAPPDGGDDQPVEQPPEQPPEQPEGESDNPFAGLFQRGDVPTFYAPEDWEPYTPKKGKRKGMASVKNKKTGEIRESAPVAKKAFDTQAGHDTLHGHIHGEQGPTPEAITKALDGATKEQLKALAAALDIKGLGASIASMKAALLKGVQAHHATRRMDQQIASKTPADYWAVRELLAANPEYAKAKAKELGVTGINPLGKIAVQMLYTQHSMLAALEEVKTASPAEQALLKSHLCLAGKKTLAYLAHQYDTATMSPQAIAKAAFGKPKKPSAKAAKAVAAKKPTALPWVDATKPDSDLDYLRFKNTAKHAPELIEKGQEALRNEHDDNPLLPAESRPELSHLEAGAVSFYTSQAYLRMNRALWQNSVRMDVHGAASDVLMGVFAKTKEFAEPVTVYRGLDDMDGEMLARVKQILVSGEPMIMSGFISTTTNAGLKDFAGNIRLKITARHGLDVKPVSQNDQEDELLLNHNCLYRVKSVGQPIPGKDGEYTEIEMEQISDDGRLLSNAGNTVPIGTDAFTGERKNAANVPDKILKNL